jgi:peroxiredoxin
MTILKQAACFSAFLLVIACGGSNETDETVNRAARVNEEHPTMVAPGVAKNQLATTVGYEVGDEVTSDFELKNVDGTMVSMGDYPDAKGYVVVFTCNHCPYSVAYEDRLIELDKEYKEKGYPVIAINPNDPSVAPDDGYDEMVVRAKEKGFTFPYLFDEGQKVYPQYGALKTPHVYVVNKTESGNRIAYIGAIDDSKDAEDVTKNYLADALDALVRGEVPAEPYTKAFGCSIKTKNGKKKM